MSEMSRVLATVEDEAWRTINVLAEQALCDVKTARQMLRLCREVEHGAHQLDSRRVGGKTEYRVRPPVGGIVPRIVGPERTATLAKANTARVDFVAIREAPAARSLKLYEAPPMLAVQIAEPIARNPECTLCAMHAKKPPRTRCMAPTMTPPAAGQTRGVLLVIGDFPIDHEDASGKPFTSAPGGRVRDSIARHWQGPVVYTNAVNCCPDTDGPTEKALTACRPYLTGVLRDASPERILCLGAWAAGAVTDRSISPVTSRRAYAHLYAEGKPPTPVFFGMSPAVAARNRFLRQWFEDDLRWMLSSNPSLAPWGSTVTVVEDEEDADFAIAQVNRAPWASFDIETRGLMYEPSFRILSISLCPEGSRDPFVWGATALADPAARETLLAWLADPACPKVGQNAKYDMAGVFALWGVMPRGVMFDTRLSRKLIDAEAEASLDKMADLVGMGGMKEEADALRESALREIKRIVGGERRAEKKNEPPPLTLEQAGLDPELCELVRDENVDAGKWSYALLPPDALHRYNGRDAVATTALAEQMMVTIAVDEGVARIAELVVNRMPEAVARVEAWGVPASVHHMNLLGTVLNVRAGELLAKLEYYAPGTNWASPVQVGDLLFRKLQLPSRKKTATGAASTDADALEGLRGAHPVVDALLEHRGIAKLQGTYAEGLRPHVRSDGRIHGSINADGTRTGRMSMSDPNLQNQPTAKEGDPLPGMVRGIFRPADDDHALVSLDYSQIELRVAAMLSGDPLMRQIFLDGDDYHQRTAEMVCESAWGITKDKITKDHRRRAKVINFGVLYGMSDGALASQLSCRVDEATRVRLAIMGKLRKLDQFCKDCLATSRRTGESRTWWAGEQTRRRPLWRIADHDDLVRSRAEHGSWNGPIQGTAAEYCAASFVACVDWIVASRVPAKLILPVHDQLIFEVHKSAIADVIGKGREIMTGWDSGGVPLLVDAEVGPSWAELEKVA